MKCRLFSAAVLLLAAPLASAAPEAAAQGFKEMNFLEVVMRGGPMMYLLGLMSVITVLLVFMFLLTIRRNAIVSDRFMNTTESLIRKRDYPGLISFCHRRNECMARICQKTLDFITANPNASFESVRDVAQVEGSHQAGLLASRITYLADIGAIAPMVGLLGTVFGMIEAFIGISSGQVAGVREMGMAEGVAKALIATAGGLAISIPALAFYSIFRGRVQKFTTELEAAATHFIALLQPQLDRRATPPGFPQPAAQQRSRDDFAMPVTSHLTTDRPDLHGI